jgi:hypothetical protein
MFMSDENNWVKTAAADLTTAMSGLLRALDAAADQSAAAKDLPEGLTEELERLSARLDALRGPGR